MRPVLLLCLLLAACDPGAGRRAIMCRHEAGPEPYAASALLGVVGVLAAGQIPERRAWNERVNQCVAEAMATER